MSNKHPGYALLDSIAGGLEQFKDRPMLIVWGAQDFCFNDDFLNEWRKRFPAALVHYVEDAGHYVVEDAHERIIGWMEAFLDGRSS